MVKYAIFFFPIILLVGLIFLYWKSVSFSAELTTITLNPNTRYQTITGWEAVAQAGQDECAGFPQYKDMLFDQAINDLGVNRLRLEILTGSENPVDYFTQYRAGQIAWESYKQHWYEIINDNGDPLVMDPTRFQFSALDRTVDQVVLPLKQLQEAKGEQLYISLNVVDFQCCQGSSTIEYQYAPEEYAEFIMATYLHLQSKYGWVPDALEVILEPDNTPWTGGQIGAAMVATANRLQANGFTPRLIGPSTTDMGNAITYFDALIQLPGVLPYLEELSYHRYAGVSDANLQVIANRAVQYGINTAMLEHIGSDHHALHTDLKIARNSAWQQYTLAYCTEDNGAQYYWIDQSDPDNPVVHLGSRTKFLRQYFKFVRRDAVRIEASSTSTKLDPLAFINADGNYVVVIKANSGDAFAIHGLPAGTYGIKYTTGNEYDVDADDITLAAGQALQATIPGSGVITIYTKATPTSTPWTGVGIAGSTTGIPGIHYRFTATISPITATLPVTYHWEATGQIQVTNTGGLSDTAGFTWAESGQQTVTVTATNAAGVVSDQHAIETVAPLSLNSVSISGPATGLSNFPVSLLAAVRPSSVAQPITYTWQADDQATVTKAGTISDTITYIWQSSGPKTVMVTAASLDGVATVSRTIEIQPSKVFFLPFIIN